MAATRLITMHQNKGKSVAKSLSDRTDCAKNGEKTENGQFISLTLVRLRVLMKSSCYQNENMSALLKDIIRAIS